MSSFLKNHPFAVEAFFESSLVLTYALPKEVLQPLLPPPLHLDSFADKWGFVAVAVVKTKSLRPKGFPSFLGNNFILTGYRIFVRYTTGTGKRLRGLYILKSETDKKKMQILGNVFTHYRYSTTDIALTDEGDRLTVRSVKSGLDIEVIASGTDVRLPAASPFNDWKEARRFAGPLPFTFTYNPETKAVLIIEGVRQHWEPQPVEVRKHSVGFLNDRGLKEAVLANAFLVRAVPYYWKKGRIDVWKP